ncbi:endonuclease IV [Candidatus Phytoplasma luffae]|uniref:Probable endonuclease 4 n=1 Tax=Loofah witches'-broom phytoplasma TaxID=35773 RepID=A0A975INS6_LOWBP|nr:deoxyribonuclease IV [Candidatus Phytoplasma luffae]QTX03216.1 endonuclease IV [Candidatus Phytoplasma luffae]
MNKLIIGSHISFKQPFFYLNTLQQALSFGANTFMIYTGAPQNTKRPDFNKIYLSETLIEMKKNSFQFNNLVGHAPYIINLANLSIEKRNFAISFLTEELKKFEILKIPQMVLHPGNSLQQERKEAIKMIAQGINQIFKNTSDLKIKIALETMSGKGTEIGYKFQELKNIIDLIEDKTRISVCFDTCHVFDAGYDIKNNFNLVMEEFNNIIGYKYLSVVHINDSKNILGSKKDRHENIGYGKIGFDSLMKIIYSPFFKSLPKILETPFINDQPPYEAEIKMIKEKKFNPYLKKIIL